MKNFNRHLLNGRDEYVSSLSSIFDDIFYSSFPDLKDRVGISLSKGAYPKVDIIDEADKIVILAELAGWKKEDLSIDVNDNLLTIQGKSSAEKSNKTYLFKELKRSSFKRSFTLGDQLDIDSIEGDFENGILNLTILKKEPELPKTRKIEL